MPRKSKEKEDINELDSIKEVSKKVTKNRAKKDIKAENVFKDKEENSSKTESSMKIFKTEEDKNIPIKANKKKSNTKKGTSSKSSKNSDNIDISTSEVKEKKTRAKKTASSSSSKKVEVLEYYDLPYRYNQTIVKILAQTPTTLFVYWDISDFDRQNFINNYGKNFFEETIPVLKIHNETQNYSFEIEINDFANSWYVHIDDSKCEYTVELGRKPKFTNKQTIKSLANDYIYITSSNELESPNGHILFEKLGDTVYFRNTKTNFVEGKKITSISFMQRMNKIYNIYDMYKKLYPNEDIGNITNPTSGKF